MVAEFRFVLCALCALYGEFFFSLYFTIIVSVNFCAGAASFSHGRR